MTILLRTVMVIAFPFCIAWAALERLGSEMRSAFRLAYFDACGEVAAFRRSWRNLPAELEQRRRPARSSENGCGNG